MKKMRVGLIGTGMIGKLHADALGRIPGVELVAITEYNKDQLQALQDHYRVNTYSDYKEMIDKENLDSIHNCTPNIMHYEINKYALENNVHVYSEKPLAVTVQQGEELTKLAESKGLANAVNFNYRNNAMVQDMRARMKSKDAGKCFLLHGHYLQDWLMFESDFNWRLDTKEGGASRALADIGSHWFDTAQTVTGQKIVAVYARNFITHKTRKNQGNSVPIATEDGGMIMFEMEDGVQGSVMVSQVSAGYKNQLFMSVDCEKYSMRWNQEQSDRLIIGARDKAETHIFAAPDAVDASVSRYATLPSGHPIGWADAFSNGFKEFYSSIMNNTFKNKEQTYSSFANATYIMKIVDACLESNEKNTWVKVG